MSEPKPTTQSSNSPREQKNKEQPDCTVERLDCFVGQPVWAFAANYSLFGLSLIFSLIGLIAAVISYNNCTEIRVALYLIVYGSVLIVGSGLIFVELGMSKELKMTARVLAGVRAVHLALLIVGGFLGIYYIFNRYNDVYCEFSFYTLAQTVSIINLVLALLQLPVLIFYARGTLLMRCVNHDQVHAVTVTNAYQKTDKEAGRRSESQDQDA